MKIMTAMYTMRRGGAYDRFQMMMEAFLERGCEVHCLSLTPIRMSHVGYKNHVISLPLKMKDSFVAKFMVLFLFPLYAIWIGFREKIDLYVAFGALYAFVGSFPKRILGKPMVTLIRGDSSFGMKARRSSTCFAWINRWIESVGIQCSNRILTVNSAMQEELKKMFGEKRGIEIKVLSNHIPSIPVLDHGPIGQTRIKYGIPENAKVLVTAGVINQGKNIEALVKCLDEIGLDSIFLLVVGEGSNKADSQYRKSLQRWILNHGVTDRVIFTGWVEHEELWKIFHCSDLFVLSSKNEGMPNVILEALGCDLPCFGSNVPGIRDILQYEELMFDPESGKDLMKKISQFFSDSLHSKRVIELCRERKKEFLFDWKEVIFQVATTGTLMRDQR